MSEVGLLVIMVVVACCAFVVGRAFESWAWKDAARFHERRCIGGQSFVVLQESRDEDSPLETMAGKRIGTGVRLWPGHDASRNR
jgi:hypothetical protein